MIVIYDNPRTILREKIIINVKRERIKNALVERLQNNTRSRYCSEKEYASLRLDKYGTLAKTLTPIWPLLSTSNSILRISPTGFRGEKLLLVASAA